MSRRRKNGADGLALAESDLEFYRSLTANVRETEVKMIFLEHQIHSCDTDESTEPKGVALCLALHRL